MKRLITYKDYSIKLEGNYKTTFNHIEFYFLTEIKELDEQLIILNDLVEMFLTAQDEGRPVSRIVGNDIDKFCKEVIQSVSSKKLLSSQFRTFGFYAFTTIIFVLLSATLKKGSLLEGLTTYLNILPYLIGFTIGIGVTTLSKGLTKIFLFNFTGFNMTVYRVLTLVLLVSLVILSVIIGTQFTLEILMLHWIVLIGCIAYIGTYLLTVSILKYKVPHKVTSNSTNDSVVTRKISFKEDLHNKSILALCKRFSKCDYKFNVKHNRFMSIAEKKKWLQKDYKKHTISWVISIIIMELFFILHIANTILTNTASASIKYILIMSVFVYIPFSLLFYYSKKARSNLFSYYNLDELTNLLDNK